MYIDTRGDGGGDWSFFRPQQFRLIGKRVVATNFIGWTWFFRTPRGKPVRRRVAHTQVTPLVFVSSAFIGLDRRELFETMTFIRGTGAWQHRSLTWGECIRTHHIAVKAARRFMRLRDRPADRTAETQLEARYRRRWKKSWIKRRETT